MNVARQTITPPFELPTRLNLPDGVIVLTPEFPRFNLSAPKVNVRDADGGTVEQVSTPPISVDAARKLCSAGVALVQSASDTLTKCAADSHEIRNNRDLSTEGRDRKLLPLFVKAVGELGMIWWSLSKEDQRVQTKEADLLAPPPLPTIVLAEMREAEIRAWFFGMPTQVRADTLVEVLGPNGNRAIRDALMHSPYGTTDAEIGALVETWQEECRAAHPATVAEIEVQQQALEWARVSIASIAAGLVNVVSGSFSIGELLLAAKDDRAHGSGDLFGLSPQSMERMKLVARARAAAATESSESAPHKDMGRLWGQQQPTAA